VFLLAVEQQVDDWREKAEKECQWMTPKRAARMVHESGLAEILLSAFPATRFPGRKAGKQLRLPR